MAFVRLAIGVVVLVALWLLGRGLASLRAKRPENVIRYEGDLLGPGVLSAVFGIAFVGMRLFNLPGWTGNGPWFLAGAMLVGATFLALLVFRYSIVLTPEAILEKRIFRSGRRRIEWKSVRSWKAGRKAGEIVLKVDGAKSFCLAPIFKEGFDAFLFAIDARNIPHADDSMSILTGD
ncbi:MAG TPA: hypothetical protein VGH02_11105 [Rhizomicrobium sp.]|jgi:hypothetical protein